MFFYFTAVPVCWKCRKPVKYEEERDGIVKVWCENKHAVYWDFDKQKIVKGWKKG